ASLCGKLWPNRPPETGCPPALAHPWPRGPAHGLRQHSRNPRPPRAGLPLRGIPSVLAPEPLIRRPGHEPTRPPHPWLALDSQPEFLHAYRKDTIIESDITNGGKKVKNAPHETAKSVLPPAGPQPAVTGGA